MRPFDFHLVQDACRQGCEKKRVEIVQAELAGYRGDPLADTRLVNVQTDDEEPTTRMLWR